MRQSNYDKYPAISVKGACVSGWNKIVERLDGYRCVAVECYTGLHEAEIKEALLALNPGLTIDTASLMKSEAEIRIMTEPDVTDDAIFGYMTRLRMIDFFDPEKLEQARKRVAAASEKTLIYGSGSSLVTDRATIVYADMPRWELQLRQRRGTVRSLGVDDSRQSAAAQYKRGFFVDWRVCDRLKKELFGRAAYWLDTTVAGQPKMIPAQTMLQALDLAAHRPFRVVPFFDPGPWGGQWMKEVCDLPRDQANYAWCFDCVPEENSLLIDVCGTRVEIPAVNLVFYRAKELLGEPVWARFGDEFPIRFDFLDTMGGGNLSLQVHPDKQYIRDHFGMDYTQDESYYILDATPDAYVYLGVRDTHGAVPLLDALNRAQEGDEPFDADRYINRFPVAKHDHILIPGGTIHCSGAGSMVLEISATPYIFTFKLWDWGRLGLDGKPRPINIKHGSNVIDWRRDTDYCRKQLVNHFSDIAGGEGWSEVSTGLHPNEFIETRRHRFTTVVQHDTTKNSVHVLNLVEGSAAIVESPDAAFEPFAVHYAETFIVPAAVGGYTIRPAVEGESCMTIKAYVRLRP